MMGASLIRQRLDRVVARRAEARIERAQHAPTSVMSAGDGPPVGDDDHAATKPAPGS